MSVIVWIYAEGHNTAFWVGDGLSVGRIFPESAIKVLTYEASVRSIISLSDGEEHMP